MTQSEIFSRIDTLEAVLTQIAPYCDDWAVQQATSSLADVRKRVVVGADFTVVALVGGTGSGKSTLFNALTGLQFADSGKLRPTTEHPTACTWSGNSQPLLDYLDIAPVRRIVQDSILTPAPAELAGLVLLDLPDYDSVKLEHSSLVQKLLPLIDVLIWVVDPQKYADEILHQGYLQALQNRAKSMAVVLNKVDTVAASGLAVLTADLQKLLLVDGVGEVPIYPVSALAKTGLEPVRNLLQDAVASPSVVLDRARVQLVEVTALLNRQIGSREVEAKPALLADLTTQALEATGISAIIQAIEDSGSKWMTPAIPVPQVPAFTLLVALRDTWLNYVVTSLPENWANAFAMELTSAETLKHTFAIKLDTLRPPILQRTLVWWALGLGMLMVLLTTVGAVVGFPFATGVFRYILPIVVVGLAVLLVILSRLYVKRQARVLAQLYNDKTRQIVNKILQEQLLMPIMPLAQVHKQARIALNSQ